MLLLCCSLEADSISRSTSFCPSTIATRSSSCCVALNRMRFTCCSRGRAGEPLLGRWLHSDWMGHDGWRSSGRIRAPLGRNPCRSSGEIPLRAFPVVSLLPESEINPCFRSGSGRAGGGLQVPARKLLAHRVLRSLCLATRSNRWIIRRMNNLGKSRATILEVGEESAAQRIDNFLLRRLKGVPKSHVYRVLRSGEVRVNSGRVKPDYRLQHGDRVRVPPVRVAYRTAKPAAKAQEFRVVFEDPALLVIDKPAGVAVHGGSGVSFGVIEYLRPARPAAKAPERGHRRDRG